MDFIHDPNLVLYLPLYELDGSSFMSKDAYRHLCTVTGAIWQPNGRYFDGTDDYISLGLSVTKAIPQMSLLAWVNPSDKDAEQTVFGDYTNSGNMSCYLNIFDMRPANFWRAKVCIKGDNIAASILLGETTTLAYGEWHLIAVTWDNKTLRMFVNCIEEGEAAYSDSQLEATVTQNTTIGAYQPAGGKQNVLGKIGEVGVYNRALSPAEIQHNYLATKWRYR